MVDPTQIKPHMPVVCSNNIEFAQVDHIEGSSLKLKKDAKGEHHYIPLSWIQNVDNQVHVDRPGQEVMKTWKTSPAS